MPRIMDTAHDHPWPPAHRFQTSWLLPPLGLAAVRATCGLYALATLVAGLVLDSTTSTSGSGSSTTARQSFSYFTVLTYWGLTGYLLAAAVYTAAHGFVLRRHNQDTHHPWLQTIANPPRLLQTLFGLVYSSILIYPFVVSVVYWALLYPALHTHTHTPVTTTWRNLSQHALNAVFALAELALPRTRPRPWLHLPLLLVVLAAYLALAFVTHADQGIYVYRFLDPSPAGAGSRGMVAAYVVGIAAFCTAVFLLVQGALWLRLRWTEGKAEEKTEDIDQQELEEQRKHEAEAIEDIEMM